MGKLHLLPACPFPLAHMQGFRHIVDNGSGHSHTTRPGWSWFPDLFSLHSGYHDVPRFLQQQEPARGNGSSQRQLQKRLTFPLPAPEGDLRPYQRAH